MLILKLGTRFRMLHYISIEEVRVWLCSFFFSHGVCVRAVVCTNETAGSFICKRMWGDAG